MTKEQRNQIIKIVITAIIGVLTVLGFYSCTTVLTTSKKGGGQQTITISTEQHVSVDSTQLNLK